ncbi:hypothetical protein B6D60_02125, partial [candidate division KSB1 bacterium 4484_87]
LAAEQQNTVVQSGLVMIDMQKEALKNQRKMLDKQDQMLDKQDKMLDKQDQMLDKQDQMLDKQDQTIGAIDKLGSATVIRGAVFMAFLAVATALVANSFWNYLLVFVFVGFFMDGAAIGFSNYFLEIGTAELRPLFISISGTLKFPVYFFPLIGGLVVDNFGYRVLFFANLVLIASGFALTFLLCEPRRGDKECEITYELTDI